MNRAGACVRFAPLSWQGYPRVALLAGGRSCVVAGELASRDGLIEGRESTRSKVPCPGKFLEPQICQLRDVACLLGTHVCVVGERW